MNLNYIIRQFKRFEKAETFISYKFLSHYYNKKPSKLALKRELATKQSGNDIAIVDDDIVKAVIANDQLPDRTTHQIKMHKQYIAQELLQSPKEIISYSLKPINQNRMLMKKSNSVSNINDIKMKRLAAMNGWYSNLRRAKQKQKAKIIPHEEGAVNKPFRQCLSTQIRETTIEDHRKMINYLEKSLKKELLFLAETVPKVTLGDFNKESLFPKQNNEFYDRQVKVKKRFIGNKQISIIPTTPRNNNSQIQKVISSIHFTSHLPKRPHHTGEPYDEIERSAIDPTQSYLIKKPFTPILKAKLPLKTPRKTPRKNPLNNLRLSQDKLRSAINTRDRLLLIIRPEKSESLMLK